MNKKKKVMKNFEIELKSMLISLADNLLPSMSGQTKLLEVVVRMTNKEDKHLFIKVIFWRPGSGVMVASSSESDLEKIKDDSFSVESDHDGCWREEGLSFFPRLMELPAKITIPLFTVINVEDAFVNGASRKFFFKRK